MKRYTLIFLLFLPFFASAINHKVVSVAPGQKFTRVNPGGGYPAPTPYSQRLMTGKPVYFPTLTEADKAQIFMRDLNRKFGYQPQAVSKKSIARTLGQMGKNASRLHPAIRGAALLGGAYVSNCITQDYPSLCVSSGGPTSESEVDLTTPFVNAQMENVVSCNASYNGTHLGTFTGDSFAKCYEAGSTAIYTKLVLPKASESIQHSPSVTLSINRSFQPLDCPSDRTSCSVGVKVTETTIQRSCAADTSGNVNCSSSPPSVYEYYLAGTVQQADAAIMPNCPPESKPEFKYGPFKPAGSTTFRCYKGTQESAADSDFFETALGEDPQFIDDVINNPEIGLDDFVDWETGQPYDSLFDDVRFDDVSEKFANAAESIMNGTAQTSDPSNTKTYIPPDVYNVTVTNVNNWFEGNTFTDTFTQQNIKPDDGQTPDGIPTDWKDFPGITQKQYEASNERWGSSAMQDIGKPNLEAEEDAAFDQVKNFIEKPTADPFSFKLADFVDLPTSGSCRGFTIEVPLSSKPITLAVDQHCPPYDAWGRPLVEWFLGILTIIQLFRIFQRTLEVA